MIAKAAGVSVTEINHIIEVWAESTIDEKLRKKQSGGDAAFAAQKSRARYDELHLRAKQSG